MSRSQKATDAEIGRMHRQVTKLYGLVESGRRSYDGVVKPLVQAAIEGRVFVPAWYDYGKLLVRGEFTPPELQIANLRALNQTLKLGIDDAAITAALFRLLRFDWSAAVYRKVPLTLCFTLATLEETFAAQLLLMQAVYGSGKVKISEMRPGLVAARRQLALAEGGAKFEPNRIWWEVVDLDAYKGKGTYGIDSRKVPVAHAASTQVLDVLYQHSPYFLGLTKEVDPHLHPSLRAAMIARSLTAKSSGSKEWELIYVEVAAGGRIKISTRPKFNSAGSYTSYPTVVKVAA